MWRFFFGWIVLFTVLFTMTLTILTLGENYVGEKHTLEPDIFDCSCIYDTCISCTYCASVRETGSEEGRIH